MLSIPHMVVLFVIVLVVFGPQKLPELARTFGKLMAEFRKASTDFKGAFEEEMRNIERQAVVAERQKAQAASAAQQAPVPQGTPAGAEIPAPSATPAAAETLETEALTVSPVAESVPRHEPEATRANPPESSATEQDAIHDHQQPA